MPVSEEIQKELDFREEIKQVINKHSREAASGTPDYILANYIGRCLDAYDQTLIERETFYGRSLKPSKDL